ncbi:glycosyltransferase family 4 protein [Iningainema tapete]
MNTVMLHPSNDTSISPDLVYQCSSFNVGSGGGVETYLGSLFDYQIPGISSQVLKSLQNVDQSKCKLLHIHSVDLLLQLTGECPAVFTVHNHSVYCPSGTKYLAGSQVVCDRNFSLFGCTWGKIVDGCGSRKPLRALSEFQHTHQILNFSKNFKKVTFAANSDYVRGQLIKSGIPREQTVTLRYGTPIPKVATAPLTKETHQQKRILFAGRIVPDKGLEWLLRALVHTQPLIKLDIAGEGWDKPRLLTLANKLGLSDRITWHGWCDSNKMNMLYQQCMAVIFPSVWPEPAGLITLEASARYRPVIASAVGGIPEHLQNGHTGILVPANDLEKLAQAITELETNYDKCRTMGEKGRDLYMHNFTLDVHVKNLLSLYEKTILDFSA